MAGISISAMRGRMMMGKKLQIDYASKESEDAFFEHMVKQGYALPPDKPWEKTSEK